MARSKKKTLFGQGVYDGLAASHLLGIHFDTIVRWSQPDRALRAVVPPTHGWAFSFHDLLSLAVVAVLRQRKVKLSGVRLVVEELERRTGRDRPLAHQDVVEGLATVGTSVLAEHGEIDLTKKGQGVLLETVQDYLVPITYGLDGMATLWRPAERVVIDPDVQVGHPTVEGTRVTTETIYDRAHQDEPLEVIARDLRVSVEDVEAAVQFESSLDERGLALVA